MRTEKSIKNVRTNMIYYSFRSIALFVVRTVFIKTLGKDLLGLDGLYTNILYMLSVAELGVSNAINFSLYEPLAKGNYNKVSILMSFYKKVYKIIGISVIGLGLIIMPFLSKIVANPPAGINIYVIYLIYLFDTCNLYFISYKETLIVADQNNYKLFKYNMFFYTFMYVIQIGVLILYKNFIVYLISKIVILFIQRLYINRFITKEYKQINYNSKEKVPKKDIDAIKKNVRGMFFHKIGNYFLNGTDNVVISSFLSLGLVGVYTNYLSLTMMTNTLLGSSYKAITASFGNLIVLEDEKMQEDVFQKINFAGHLLYSFVSIAFIVLINDFVYLWIGKNYLLSIGIVVVICLNFYLDGLRLCLDSIKDASGTYDQDKYIPLLQAVINIVISLILVKPLGILGVVLGTLISNIVLPCWNRPYVVYKYVFKAKPYKYYFNFIKYILAYGIIAFVTFVVKNQINLPNTLIGFIINIIIYVVLYGILVSIIYFKNENYRFYLNMLIRRIKAITKRA